MTIRRVWTNLGIRPESGSFDRLMILFMVRFMSQLKTRRMVAVVEAASIKGESAFSTSLHARGSTGSDEPPDPPKSRCLPCFQGNNSRLSPLS